MRRRITASPLAFLTTGDSFLNVTVHSADLPTHLMLGQSLGKIQQPSTGVYGKEGKAVPGSAGHD